MMPVVQVGMLFLLVFCCAAITANGEHLGPPSADIVPSTAPESSTTTKTNGPEKKNEESAGDEEETPTVDDSLESPDPEYENDADTDSIKIFSTTELLHEHLAMLYKHISMHQENERGQSGDAPYNPLLFGLEGSQPASEGTNRGSTVNAGLSPEELEMKQQFDVAVKQMHKSRNEWNLAKKTFAELAQKRHLKSAVQYAWMALLSKPIGESVENTRVLMSELAKDGMPEAHTALGFMYATGIGMNVSQAKAVVHYTIGAMGDDHVAQMALGYRFWSGVTVPASCERALVYYKRVAVKVASKITFSGGSAVHRIRLLDEAENTVGSGGYIDNDLIEYYQMMAEKGDINSQVGLGQLHYQGGRGLPQDMQKALHYFTPAANTGNAVAIAFLGKIYLEGNDYVKASNETALKYFTKAAELGNPVGQSGLGIMYLHGKGVVRDTLKAFNYFTQAAEQGWVDGQLQLGNMYFTGTGVKRDFKQANKFFNLASQSGHVLAYYNLGQMHALGLGVIRSCPTAVELFKNVAERGKWSERLMSAHQDYKAYRIDDAFKKYSLAGEMGYEVGQSNAAFLLDRAEVTLFPDRTEQLVRALQLWSRSAAQGYSAAQVKLGDYHYYGLGTQVDYDAAASHYRMASDQQHNAQAMFNLGYMHEQGLGMQQDWHLAKRCYDLAAATSVDAKVPVALALLKLSVMFKLEYLKDSPFQFFLELDENITSNWDLYLITGLTLLLGFFIYMRRPQFELQQQPPPPRQPVPVPPVNNPAAPPNPPVVAPEEAPLVDDVQ